MKHNAPKNPVPAIGLESVQPDGASLSYKELNMPKPITPCIPPMKNLHKGSFVFKGSFRISNKSTTQSEIKIDFFIYHDQIS